MPPDPTLIEEMNYYGARRIPFLFIIDFLMLSPVVIPVSEINRENILYNINGRTNVSSPGSYRKSFRFRAYPVGFEEYESAFNIVLDHEKAGNSYLANLTFKTRISTNLTLLDIFETSRALYKLYFRDEFVVFSPEEFVRIERGKISTFPMKGTIDASIPDAEKILRENEKELAEHVTIVDLMRNDLNMVARNVTVEKFRYFSRIETNKKQILQTSSVISGDLGPDYPENIGTIVVRLLPAGSVTGAPKKKTIEIIREAEPCERGYYTGVFGWSDGEFLESAVMIRFIEKRNGTMFARSGGGITIYSEPRAEYEEMIDKVYVPFA